MKRTFTLLFAVVMTAMTAMAEKTTSFTDNLVITVDNNAPVTQTTTINVTEQDNGKYKFELKDFKFGNNKVGDVVLEDVQGTKADGVTTLVVDNVKTKIQNAPLFSLGSLINLAGGVTISMTAKISDSTNKMFADMTMKGAGQNIKATFGDEKNITTGIKAPQATTKANNATSIFTLAGQQVSSMTSGNVYIVKTTDGKTKKVIKK